MYSDDFKEYIFNIEFNNDVMNGIPSGVAVAEVDSVGSSKKKYINSKIKFFFQIYLEKDLTIFFILFVQLIYLYEKVRTD